MSGDRVTALIVDDEPIARRKLRRLVEELSWVQCVGEAGDGESAIAAIDRQRPDVVFLDIHLPGRSGLDVLRRVRHRPAVIFTTAYDRYAVTAFELHAVDYLLKPFGRERLRAAVERVRAAPRNHHSRYDSAVGAEPSPLDRLYVRDRGTIQTIPIDSVTHFEARGDYVGVWSGGRRHLIHVALRDIEKRLDARFVRIHRSHIVNIDHIATAEAHAGARLRVTLADGTKLVASRARSRELRRRLE